MAAGIEPAVDTNDNFVGDALLKKTEAANTEIVRMAPPRTGQNARVSKVVYTTAGTSHNLYFMTPYSQVTVASEAASGQATLVLSSIPTLPDGLILAAGDFLVFQYEDGYWETGKITSISGNTVTFSRCWLASDRAGGATANLNKKVLKSSTVHVMGAPADHDQRLIETTTSSTETFEDASSGLCTSGVNEPILFVSSNGTAAGTVKQFGFHYLPTA